ncbi:hypothetical protein Back2_08030 [Nocardioides baekrokdamisoli]|uniref:Uncharacterized protein n=1 Tax=Nocardioides baekrokdamisoli TaxID=1804624 RepID=A0A3G9IDU1_9ACTN|nr:DUF5719 family protein [Nocardioides baekrokdamisoli]BBH16516.1 hypothetical protein Back2_08030 [Nocardioides baekrokdamisoli]
MSEFETVARSSVRRLRTRGLDPLVVISALLVLATIGFAAVTLAHPGSGRMQGPRNVSFSGALRGCPSTASGTSIRVGSLGTGTGGILTRQGSAPPTQAGVVHPSQTTDIPAGGQPRAVVVTGPAAAGLAVGAFGTGPLSGTRCLEPSSDYWFTGLGAASTHDSIIEIDNPADTGAEVVITRYSSRTAAQPVVDDRVLAPHSSVSIDLFKDSPQYGVFAIHAAVVQGQATVSVLDQAQTPGQSALSDWLIPQTAPIDTVTLLGVPHAARHTLTVANPGADQVTATIRLVTKSSMFAPAKFTGIPVPGNGVATADLSAILAGAKDVIGIEVDAPSPITASLASIVGNDLAITGADPLLTAEGGTVVPDGNKTVVIGAAAVAGSVNVIARDSSGKVVFRSAVPVTTMGAVSVTLPTSASLVQIQTNRISLRAAIVVTGNGAVVVPVGRVIRVSSVPYVRPGVG